MKLLFSFFFLFTLALTPQAQAFEIFGAAGCGTQTEEPSPPDTRRCPAGEEEPLPPDA